MAIIGNRIWIGIVMAVMAALSLVLISLTGPFSEESRVLGVARAWLFASHDQDFVEVWELMSVPARNYWAEVHEAEKHEGLPEGIPFHKIAKRLGAGRFEDPRDLFLSAAKVDAEEPSEYSRVAGEIPTVEIDAAKAVVTWPLAKIQMHLALESGAWKVHGVSEFLGNLVLRKAPGGREVPVVIWTELFRVDEADLKAWWDRLPRLPGQGTVEPDCDGTYESVHDRVIRLFVGRAGLVKHFGLEIASDDLLEFLFQRADARRDLEHPNQPSIVPVVLHLDRELPVRGFRSLLLLLTAPEVRIGSVHVPARFDNTPAERVWYDVGFTLSFDLVMYLTTCRVRAVETAVDLVLRDTDAANSSDDLTASLKAMPAVDRKKGVRLRCGPGIATERLLRVLAVLAQQEDLRVVLDLRQENAPETEWDLELDGKPVHLVGPTGEVNTDLELEMWR